MSLPVRTARRTARLATLTGVTGALLPLYLARKRLARAHGADISVHNAWMRVWAKTMLHAFGVEAEQIGALPAPREHGRLIVCNHRSAIDIVLMQSLFGGHLVSRADLSGWPLIGAAARAVGTIFLDRSSARSGAATLRTLEHWLREGRTVILFPEGTTFAGDEVRPFHAGSFVAAARGNAEIVPVGVAYEANSEAGFVGESFGAHLLRVSAAPTIRLAVTIGDPLPPPSRAEAHAFARDTRSLVQGLVDRSRARLDASPARLDPRALDASQARLDPRAGTDR